MVELGNPYEIFVKNIKRYRKRKNMTQEQLAEKAQISLSYLKQIESERTFTNITYTTLYNLAIALEVTFQDLFREE